MNIVKERRKYKRYALREGGFAGKYPKIGEIKNISLGGVSFCYLDINNTVDETGDFVICGDDGACLTSVIPHVVSDRAVNDQSDFSKIITRERRISFEYMDDEQKIRLNNFIKNHRIGLID
jgi:hypothetical protein